ncbi:NADH dehydrogenase (plasmid) [Alteromonas sp. I4]|nr:NADH dehydrogenase [Alteromonas sp. I4]
MTNSSGTAAMSVTESILARHSVRAFSDKPVPGSVVQEILEIASRSASGGNLQPWRVYALSGEPLSELVTDVVAKAAEKGLAGDGDFEYEVYPRELGEPYKTHRFQSGETLYAALGIERADKAGRGKQFMNNFRFFGAPVGLFFCIDRQMGSAQWADIGIFMQSVMLLAVERGLGTCPQEAWSLWHKTVRAHCEVPDELIIFCGMALGYPDDTHPVNKAKTGRVSASEFTEFKGF